MKTRLRDRFTRIDIVAMAAFAVLWIYYIIMVRYGVCFADEIAFVGFAERFVSGDRPMVDEWHVAQLSFLFLCPVYRLYMAVKDSTDGIILFLRYLFLAFNALFYWVMYKRLRAYRWPALIATLWFSIYIPCGIFAGSYYTLANRLVMIACLLLFFDEKKPRRLFFAGVLLSWSVLEQPTLALLYAVYTGLVWTRCFLKKKSKRFLDDFAFCVNMQSWKYLSFGVFVCAAGFLFWLLKRSGLRNIVSNFPYLLMNPEYDYTAQGSASMIIFKKIWDVFELYGFVCVFLAIAVFALTIAYSRGLFRARRETAQKCLFCLACSVWIFSCVKTVRISAVSNPVLYFLVYPAPLMWLGLICYLLCTKKDKRLLFFWAAGLCSSLCVDIVSEVSLSTCSPITFIADFVFFADLMQEICAKRLTKQSKTTASIRDAKKNKRIHFLVRTISALTCFCFAVWSAYVVIWMENTIVPLHYLSHTPVQALSCTYVCEKGPCRSLHYFEDYQKNYAEKLDDIDTIKKKRPKNLYICALSPELYLYAGLPYAAYSLWTYNDARYMNQSIRYWKLHPDRLPECIYIPIDLLNNFTDDEDSTRERILSFIDETYPPLCEYTLEEGQSGYILYVSQWHLDSASQ